MALLPNSKSKSLFSGIFAKSQETAHPRPFPLTDACAPATEGASRQHDFVPSSGPPQGPEDVDAVNTEHVAGQPDSVSVQEQAPQSAPEAPPAPGTPANIPFAERLRKKVQASLLQ